MHARWFQAATLAALLPILTGTPAAQTPAAATPYTVLSKDGRRPLPARTIGGQEMFALDDLVRLFDLTVREDAAAGGLTVTVRNQTIVLSAGQGLASVGGRLISLSAPPVRDGRAWFVPVDFVGRALAPAIGTRLELRRPSHLILLGDVRAPLVAGRVELLGSLARLTLDVAPATPHTVVQEGNRLVIRFEADTLDATLPAPTAPDSIQAVRPGDGAAAIAIDLGPRFGSFRTSDLPGDRGAARLVVDVIAQAAPPTDTPAPQPTPPAPQDLPPLLDLAPTGGVRTIVIDAGHGGKEEGAHGRQGVVEKQVTLSVARRLKAALEARMGVRVLLTRDGDATVGLDERAAMANNNKADLFVSLHVNASVRSSSSGAEVYYLSLDEYGDAAQRAARADSDSLPIFSGGSRDIEVIPWEMAQARYIDESAALARSVEAALREHVPISPRSIQQAPFRVLVGANMPAILVEMAFVTNETEEKALASDAFQGALVQGLLDGIIRFRDARGAGPARPGAPAPGAAR